MVRGLQEHSNDRQSMNGFHHIKAPVIALAFALALAEFVLQPVLAAETGITSERTTDAKAAGLGERSRLTGDWGGVRSEWEAAGVNLNLEFTQFYQGLLSGTGSHSFEYGSRLDGFVDLDTAAMGLWEGGGFHSHLEYRFGNLPADMGNTFFPNNAGMGFSTDSADTLVASSLYLSQRLGDKGSLLIGKINALDTLKNDFFFGGWGNNGFMNTVFAAPPSGLVPPVFFGAIASYQVDPSMTVSLWVYDPEDRPLEYWPDDLFSNGATFYLTSTYSWEIGGRPTKLTATGIYSTKTGTDFSSVADGFEPLEPSTEKGSYSLGFQFSHLLRQNPSNPDRGWGLVVKGAISDGNPNYVQNAIIVGIGGTGLFPERELDRFGLGYFYYDLSDALGDSLSAASKGITFGDEQGIEAFYSYSITPWFYLTGDLQYIRPPRSTTKDAFIAALRTNIRF